MSTARAIPATVNDTFPGIRHDIAPLVDGGEINEIAHRLPNGGRGIGVDSCPSPGLAAAVVKKIALEANYLTTRGWAQNGGKFRRMARGRMFLFGTRGIWKLAFR